MFVYDITNEASFHDISKMIGNAKEVSATIIVQYCSAVRILGIMEVCTLLYQTENHRGSQHLHDTLAVLLR